MSLRLLLIDDNPLEREIALEGLRRLTAPLGPAEVRIAGDCSSARRELAAAGELDAILLDYNLPDGTGLEFLHELQGREHPPVIMMTGQRDVHTAVETLRAGAYDYVTKTGAWGAAVARTVERVTERVGLERALAESRRQLERYAADLEHKVATRTAMVRAQAAKIEELCLKIEESARVKAEIIANVSHELRTPLNTILGYTELLQEELPRQDLGEARQMLASVRTQADRLRHLVESLLALGRMRTGAETVMPCRFTLTGLVEELRAEAQVLCGDRDLRFEWRTAPPGAEAETDREKVGAIAYHLLSNAIKFTHAGQITLEVEALDDGGLRLRVSDTGIGVPAETQAIIFEDFRQLDGSSTRRYEGVGLGLGIVKRYTALLRGTLRVDSTPGEGTTVTVELPAIAIASEAEVEPPHLGTPRRLTH